MAKCRGTVHRLVIKRPIVLNLCERLAKTFGKDVETEPYGLLTSTKKSDGAVSGEKNNFFHIWKCLPEAIFFVHFKVRKYVDQKLLVLRFCLSRISSRQEG